MSFDQQLADANRVADDLRTEMKWAMKKLGGVVDDDWNDETLIAQFRNTVEASINSKAAPGATATAGGTVQTGPIAFDMIEREVSITFSQETRTFETTGVRGRIMFAIAHELKNTPSKEADIIRAMVERGWNHPRQSVSPELAKLVKLGDLVRDDATYRLAGKLILTIDGKKV